jgi:hypothetical protein
MRALAWFRSVVWPAVFAVALAAAAILVAVLEPRDVAVAVALSGAAIASAVLANRA